MIAASILIRSKNEEKYIGKVLEMINKQDLKNVETIIVDSGSTDNTLKIAKEYNVKIFEIKPEDFTYGYALNYGFERAAGKYVVCLSAHAIPVNQTWLSSLLSNFTEERIAGVMGKEIPDPARDPFEYIALTLKYKKYKQKKELIHNNGLTFGNANCAIKKQIWKDFPFNESLSFGEDYEWAGRVMGAKYKLLYEPKAEVYHSHDFSIKGIYCRFYNHSKAERFIMDTKRNKLSQLLINIITGSIYDMFYIIVKGYNIKWLPIAYIRRVALNYGRYKGYRQIDISASLFESTIKRVYVQFVRKLNDILSKGSCFLVKLTGKSPYPIHPKHLLQNNPHHFWYLDFIKRTDNVLDIGCGNGMHTIKAAGKSKSVTGIDYSAKNVDIAKKIAEERGMKNVYFSIIDVEEKLNFKNESFDTILFLDVLEHLHDDISPLKECNRVLIRGGSLLLAVPNIETSWKKMQKKLGLLYYSDRDHKREYTLNEITRKLEASGFKVCNVMPVVYDTPWYGVIDFIGAISLRIYAKLLQWKRNKVIDNINESNGFKIVAEKIQT